MMVAASAIAARIAAGVVGGASFALGMILMEKAAEIRKAKKMKANSFWDKMKNKITTTRR